MPTLLALALILALQTPALQTFDPVALVDSLTTQLQQRYIDVDVAARMTAAVRKQLAAGVYAPPATRAEIAQSLTRTLQDISSDKHLRVFDRAPTPVAQTRRSVVGRVEVMPGNIGYIEMPTFGHPPAVAAADVAAAMAKVTGTAALIIDVRGNGGGMPATVALVAAYVLDPGSVLLSTIENRSLQSRMENRTPAAVDGPRYGTTRPVYVLIDRRSASAAESLAYFLQAFKRATIVGELSAGAANPGGMVRLPSDFAAFIPTGRVTNPITGTNWEGVGVKPDIATEASAALDAALKEVRRYP